MTGLIIKDLMVLKKYGRTLAIISVFYLIWGYTMDNIYFVGGFITLLFSMLVTTAFHYDDAAKWETYALTMPITRKELIAEKYTLGILSVAAGFVISFLCCVILTYLKKQPVTSELFITLSIMFGMGIFVQSLIIPVIIKLGTEKSRVVMIAIFLVPSVLVVGIMKKLNLSKPSDEMLRMIEKYLPWIAGILILVLLYISYQISIRIIEKKDL